VLLLTILLLFEVLEMPAGAMPPRERAPLIKIPPLFQPVLLLPLPTPPLLLLLLLFLSLLLLYDSLSEMVAMQMKI